MNAQKQIQLGVIGADRRGRISLRAHQPENGFHVVAACSLTPECLGIYQEECGESVILTDDYRAVTGHPEIDAVLICSPDFLHEEHALSALENGKDVFLEKPKITAC